ncbi:uncharacterized protein LOC126992961 [Eriocheir sinensis]|uniref:uncharacterized protein LOC126992961 n=1 Tax=Eriocheir sinensis TaxID=95602 RepID=UPI0021CAD7EE|nr:uncharacterized protein LOC126992961 [Eriocheir sinensis]
MSSDEAAEVDAGGERVSHDDNSDGDVPEPSRGRKRTRNPAVWKKNVAKHKRNVGEAYISVKTNRHVAARAIGPPCADGCFDRVGREGIRAIFEAFWALLLGDYELQNAYIQKLVKTVPIKRKRTLAEVSRRSHTFLYSVMINGASHSVCKRGFASMHGLSLSRVESASKKMTLTGTLIADKRGRRVPQNKIVGMQADRVREHIKLLPAMSCHYSRFKAPHRRYLDSSLTIKKLYDSYVEWMEKEHSNEPFVTFSYYSDVFTKEFNICFAPPDSDTCTTCDTLNAAIKNDAENLEKVAEHQMNLQAHKAEADEAQNLMKIWKNNDDDDVRAVAVDLQQTLPTPRLSAGISYYKRSTGPQQVALRLRPLQRDPRLSRRRQVRALARATLPRPIRRLASSPAPSTQVSPSSPWYLATPCPAPASHSNAAPMLSHLRRVDATKKPLQQPYDGPFTVIKRTRKNITIDRHGKSDVIAIDRVKPAYLLQPDPPRTNTVSVSPTPVIADKLQCHRQKHKSTLHALCPYRGVPMVSASAGLSERGSCTPSGKVASHYPPTILVRFNRLGDDSTNMSPATLDTVIYLTSDNDDTTLMCRLQHSTPQPPNTALLCRLQHSTQ